MDETQLRENSATGEDSTSEPGGQIDDFEMGGQVAIILCGLIASGKVCFHFDHNESEP